MAYMASLVSIVDAVVGATEGLGRGAGAWAWQYAAPNATSSKITQILSLIFLGISYLLGATAPRNYLPVWQVHEAWMAVSTDDDDTDIQESRCRYL